MSNPTKPPAEELKLILMKRNRGARLRTPHVVAVCILLALAACVAPKKPDVPDIALIGDSTVTDNKGWGASFANALAPNAVVHNFAASGRSSKSYTDEERLTGALAVSPD